ncbi:MAG: lysylphosphatidylglycerol synthase transmembrane domain-containing protein [Chitinispirillaceae bacterium]|jgi:uncharacterized protein (TIRG00374 family)
MFDNKGTWLRRLGIPLAAIPILWIYWRLNFHAMLSMLLNVTWWTAPMMLCSGIAIIALQGFRWWILLHAFIPELPLRRALSYHFMAIFYGTVLPTSAAQDVIKTLIVAKNNDSSVSWASFWLTRMLGLPVLVLLSTIGILSVEKIALPKNVDYLLVLFNFIICGLFLISFSKRMTRPFRHSAQKVIPVRWLGAIERIRESVYCFRNRKKEVLLSFFSTVIVQALLVVMCALLILGITGRFPLRECLAFIPLIELVSTAFPFTPNGMGIRETLTAGMFAYLHISKEHLGIYVMFVLFFSLVPRLVGLPFIFHGYHKGKLLNNTIT